MTERIQLIMEALELNQTQAMILSKLIEDIPDNKMIDFFVFRMNYIQPMRSKELITKMALFDYRAKQVKALISSGNFSFKDIEEVKEFLLTYYKGREIGNGLGNFYPYVIIGLDSEGEFINKFKIEEFTGKYRKLDSEDVNLVLNDLLENPTKIGNVKVLETKRIENK